MSGRVLWPLSCPDTPRRAHEGPELFDSYFMLHMLNQNISFDGHRYGDTLSLQNQYLMAAKNKGVACRFALFKISFLIKNLHLTLNYFFEQNLTFGRGVKGSNRLL